jgi:hypothetical protein
LIGRGVDLHDFNASTPCRLLLNHFFVSIFCYHTGRSKKSRKSSHDIDDGRRGKKAKTTSPTPPFVAVHGKARQHALARTTELFFSTWEGEGQHRHNNVFRKVWVKMKNFPHATMEWWEFLNKTSPEMQAFLLKVFVNDVVDHISHAFVVGLLGN